MMHTLTEPEYREAILRRRILMTVKYPAIVRMFPKGTSDGLVADLVRLIRPETLAAINTQTDYNQWVERTIENPCWKACIKGVDVEPIRWAHVGKIVNIAIYDVLDCHQLIRETDRLRLWPWLHVPIDSVVQKHCKKLEPSFAIRKPLIRMTKEDYRDIQERMRDVADKQNVPPIWFEAVWSAERGME